jgi:hypothetical protein
VAEADAGKETPSGKFTFLSYEHPSTFYQSINPSPQILLLDETGWSGFYGTDLKGVACLSQQQFREEVYRATSNVREHVTLLPPVLVILGDNGHVAAIHHLTPLFVYPRKYVSTRMAQSAIDPANLRESNNELTHFSRGAKRFQISPQDLPTPLDFPRYVAASESGNVNSVIVHNFLNKSVFPEVRAHGVSDQETLVLNWDRHSSHDSQALLTDLAKQKTICSFFPGHATNWLQLQDAKNGQFQVLKTTSKKDMDKWNTHLRRKGQSLNGRFPVRHSARLPGVMQAEGHRRRLAENRIFPPQSRYSVGHYAEFHKVHRVPETVCR